MIVIGYYQQQGQQKPVNTCSAKAKVQLRNDKYKCYRGKKGDQGILGCDKHSFLPMMIMVMVLVMVMVMVMVIVLVMVMVIVMVMVMVVLMMTVMMVRIFRYR